MPKDDEWTLDNWRDQALLCALKAMRNAMEDSDWFGQGKISLGVMRILGYGPDNSPKVTNNFYANFVAGASDDQLREFIAKAVALISKVKADPLYWLRNWTQTFDEHWKMVGANGPYQPFPRHPYFDHVFDFLSMNPLVAQTTSKVRNIPKSRDLMLTWSCLGFLTHLAMTGFSKVAFQSQNKDKAIELIRSSKVLYDQQPQFLKDEFPLKAGYRIEDFPMESYEYGNGSVIFGVPEGADAIRSFHPTALLMDECAFQPEGRDAYDTAYHACGYIILLSTAAPTWFAAQVLN